MALSYVFAVLDRCEFITMYIAKVVLFKLTFRACLVINWGTTKVVMRDPVSLDTVLLGEFLLLAYDTNLVNIARCIEECIILVRCCAIVDNLFKAHAEVCCTHRVRVSHVCLFS